MMTRLTSFMIEDILGQTRYCRDDDVTDDVIAYQLIRATDKTASATGDDVNCCARFVNLRNLRNALCNFEIFNFLIST